MLWDTNNNILIAFKMYANSSNFICQMHNRACINKLEDCISLYLPTLDSIKSTNYCKKRNFTPYIAF